MNSYSKFIYILIFLFCTVASSCFKDKGNYNYSEITQIKIDSFGKKAALYQDSFFLTPQITSLPDGALAEDTSRYSYVWTLAVVSRDVAKGDVPLLTLSTSRNLRCRLTMRPTAYVLYFKMTDRVTGNIYHMQTDLTVTTSTYEGWLMLTDINNVTRLDMVSFPQAPLTDTLLIKDVMNGSEIPVTHGPREISYVSSSQGSYVYFTAADGGHKLDPDLFSWKSSYDLRYECLFDYGAIFSPGFVSNHGSGGSYMLYYNNNYYYMFQPQAAVYGLPVNRVIGENYEFDAAPYEAKPTNVSFDGILFDRTLKRFVRVKDTNPTGCTLLTDDPASPNYKFSWTPNMDLVYMVGNQYSYNSYAFLKNPANNKVYVYSWSLTNLALTQNFAKELAVTDIDKAERFAVSPEYNYMFYSVGSKIYEVDFDNPTVSKLVLDLGSKKISLLKFHQFRSYTKFAPQAKCLMVGSYDPGLPAGSCGTLSQYYVPGLFGDPILSKSWSGFGKIVSLTYRER